MRCLRRDEQQLRVFGRAFHAVVRPRERFFEIVADVFVKLLVLLIGNVFFRTCPQRAGGVDGFPFIGGDHLARLVFFFRVLPDFFFHLNRQADVVGIFANQLLDVPSVQVLFKLITQMQYHARTTRFAADDFGGECARAIAHPTHRFSGRRTCAA